MKRRRFLGGLTALASAGALTLGSGAFTTSRVNRAVFVSTADDEEAYLALEEISAGGRAIEDGGQLRFHIPGVFEDQYGSGSSGGVGEDSVYRFGSDAGGKPGSGLFQVSNNGSQPVVIYSTQRNTSGVPMVTMYSIESQSLLTKGSPSEELEPGESLTVGLEIDTHNAPAREEEYEIDLIINAVNPTD